MNRFELPARRRCDGYYQLPIYSHWILDTAEAPLTIWESPWNRNTKSQQLFCMANFIQILVNRHVDNAQADWFWPPRRICVWGGHGLVGPPLDPSVPKVAFSVNLSWSCVSAWKGQNHLEISPSRLKINVNKNLKCTTNNFDGNKIWSWINEVDKREWRK